ncbi:helix-turn-helix domain-containing protein [Candidatus Uhrbacteria bacterium]|nr:helix-turn-helix domain-containing protein [Candidatus Uhrbacteria bacterium]
MAFLIRKLGDQEPLGSRLRTLRKLANRTLSELEQETKIPKKIIAAFEENAYDKLPAPIYSRHLLRLIVRTLGAEPVYFIERFDSERGTSDFLKEARLPLLRRRARDFFVPAKLIKALLLSSLLAAFFGYLGLEVRAAISAPVLSVYSPDDGLETKEALVHIVGETETRAHVRVNNRPVLLSPDGSFSTDVFLRRGVNLITIESAKRYSRPTQEYRRVIFTP